MIFLCGFALLSCSKFNFGDDDKRYKDPDGKRGTSRFDRDVLPFEELKPDLFTKNCSGYQSDVRSFRFSDILFGSEKNNPFRNAENCLLRAMDRSLKPVCNEEKILKEELKEGNYSDEDIEEIEERLESLEEFKYEYADNFYEIADNTDEAYDIIQDGVDDKVTDGITNLLVDMFVSREVRSYGDVIALRARKLCGSNLRKRDREDD